VHARPVVERGFRLGRHPDAGGRQVAADVGGADAAGEGDVVVETELGGQRLEALQRVAEAQQGEVHVGAAETVDDHVGGPQHHVDPVLVGPGPDVSHQVAAAGAA